jgi:hypothetical protein
MAAGGIDHSAKNRLGRATCELLALALGERATTCGQRRSTYAVD